MVVAAIVGWGVMPGVIDDRIADVSIKTLVDFSSFCCSIYIKSISIECRNKS